MSRTEILIVIAAAIMAITVTLMYSKTKASGIQTHFTDLTSTLEYNRATDSGAQ